MKRICIKLGGRLLSDAQMRDRMAQALARVFAEENELVLVHGGGAQLGEACAAMGLCEERYEGLRLTNRATAKVATWVLAGEVNKALVQSLTRLGLPALGLCGADLGLFHPRRKEIPGVNLGYVGELSVEDVKAFALDGLISMPSVPVLATMGPEADAEDGAPLLNVNADEAAGPIASAAQVDELLFLSDVEGVRSADGTVLSCLDQQHSQKLIEDGIIDGGMIPKVRAALAALESGVPSVRIASGLVDDPVSQVLNGGGTQFVLQCTTRSPFTCRKGRGRGAGS
jgi:acetylglutamate kinase